MKTTFICPTCNKDLWTEVETFEYLASDHELDGEKSKMLFRRVDTLLHSFLFRKPKMEPINYRNLTLKEQKARKILFEIWFPNPQKIELKSIYCNECGYMTYRPRPEIEDMHKKYLTTKKGIYQGERTPQEIDQAVVPTMNIDYARVHRLEKTLKKYLRSKKLKILDYGGGNGQMLLPFVDMGHDCYLVDYTNAYFPGITKFGDDILDIPNGEKFDVIICSHVLEHLVEPQRIIQQLKQHIKEDGFIYVEVPHQIWAGIRCIGYDPITHINFFTEKSLEYLLKKNGYSICEVEQKISNYGKNFMEVVFLVAQVNADYGEQNLPEPDIMNFLYPSRSYSLKRYFLPKILKIKSYLAQALFR